MDLQKPRPVPTATSQPFWDGLSARTIRLQHCPTCELWIFYPRHRCPRCLGDELRWEEASGRGRLYTFTVVRTAALPSFEDELPQIVAVVELEEGVRLTTTLVEVDPDAMRVGDPVEPVFDTGPDGITLLRYRLSKISGT